MKKVIRFIMLVSVALVLVACSNSAKPQPSEPETQPTASLSEEFLQQLQTTAYSKSQMLKMLGASSVQYAVVENGEVLVSGNSNEELSNETQYNIGSISKIVTTAAAMQLIDEGKFTLDTPIVDIIPEFTMADERYKDITVRMLMNHSSGLPGNSFRDGFVFNDPDTETHDMFLEDLKTVTLKADPGAYSVYCNDGFMLLEIVVERASGQNFTDYLKEHIFTPLHMTNSNTPQNMDTSKQAPILNPANPTEVLPSDVLNIIGTGGIFSTAEDMGHFASIYLSEQGLLSEESLTALSQSEVENSLWIDGEHTALKYGLGWDCVDTYPFDMLDMKAYVKGGDTMYSHGSIITIPEHQLTAVVLSVGSLSTYDQMMATDLLLQVMQEKGIISELPQVPQMPTATESVPLDFDPSTVEGLYAISNSMVEVQFDETGTMQMILPDYPDMPTPFYYLGDGKFVECSNPMVTQILRFEQLNGETVMFVEALTNIEGVGSSYQSVIYGQRVEENVMDEATAKAWEARNGKTYYLLTEEPSSQLLQVMPPIAPISIYKGYAAANKIVDENNAVPFVTLPGTGSRDTFTYHFEQEDGVEYLTSGTERYISQDAVTPLQEMGEITLNEQGDIQWHTVDSVMAQKTVKFDIPENNSVVVYDDAGTCIYNSYVTDAREVTLVENGFIGFVGEAGATFTVSLVQ